MPLSENADPGSQTPAPSASTAHCQCHFYSVSVKPSSKNPVAIFSERGHSTSIQTEGAGAGDRVQLE